MTKFMDFPAEEAEKTIEAMKQAEGTGDIEALKWCAPGQPHYKKD
jgi:hypothetical protein